MVRWTVPLTGTERTSKRAREKRVEGERKERGAQGKERHYLCFWQRVTVQLLSFFFFHVNLQLSTSHKISPAWSPTESQLSFPNRCLHKWNEMLGWGSEATPSFLYHFPCRAPSRRWQHACVCECAYMCIKMGGGVLVLVGLGEASMRMACYSLSLSFTMYTQVKYLWWQSYRDKPSRKGDWLVIFSLFLGHQYC